MDKVTFLERAQASSERAVEFAREFSLQELPTRYLLLVFPNSSCDFNLREGEVVFPDESLPRDTCLGPMNLVAFVDRFWRDGIVPEWIDVGAAGVREATTLLEVLVCGRFTSDETLLYHQNTGRPPFSVKGPSLPPDWRETGPRKFDINWRRDKWPLKTVAPASGSAAQQAVEAVGRASS